MAELGEVARLDYGFAFDSKGFNTEGRGLPLVRIRDVIPSRSDTYYSGEYADRYIVNDGDYLIGMDGQFNLARWRGGKALLNQRVCRIGELDAALDRAYLARFMPLALKILEDATPFVTVKHLSAKALNAIQVPLPPLPEQRRIAAILDHADALRAKRRQVLAHLDVLTQSIFHDMFGNPDRAADDIPLGAVAGLAGGRNLVAGDSKATSDYRVLKISAVTTGQFKPWESKPLPQGYVPPTNHLVRAGDLLMSRANTAELVGAVALVDSAPANLALPDKIWRFEWRIEAEPTFWHALLSTGAIRGRISGLASGTGGSMKNVAKAKLEAMPVPRIGIHRQREFAHRSHQLVVARKRATAALAADDELFTSLQARAFDGRL